MASGSGERIVVGYDGSRSSVVALEWAMDEAHRRGARVEIVHAWQFPVVAFTGYGTTTLPLIAPEDLEKAAGEVKDDALAAAAKLDPTVEVTAGIKRGHPTEVLVAAAEGADLVVVGSRGRGGFTGMLLGSVSQTVASHAPCPVVIVR